MFGFFIYFVDIFVFILSIFFWQGRFEIISLSGSFMFSENNGNRRSGGLSVSLAGPDGQVFGGGVAGMLMAATPVQVSLRLCTYCILYVMKL